MIISILVLVNEYPDTETLVFKNGRLIWSALSELPCVENIGKNYIDVNIICGFHLESFLQFCSLQKKRRGRRYLRFKVKINSFKSVTPISLNSKHKLQPYGTKESSKQKLIEYNARVFSINNEKNFEFLNFLFCFSYVLSSAFR